VPAYREARERISAVNACLQENVTAIRVTQAFRRERRNARDFAELAWSFRDSRLRAQRYMGTFFPFVEFLGTLSTAAVLAVGAGQVRSGALSAGTLIAFLLYVELFFSPIQQLSQVFDGYQQAVVGLGRLRTLMQTPTGTPPADDARPVGKLRGEIELDSVSFGYTGGGGRQVLHGVCLRIAPGETVALMGRNGAGKSTLLAALVGLVGPTTGTVLVGGRAPHRSHPRDMVRRVGLVPQEPRDLLYADTVAAECAAADADAGAAAGSCRALVSELLPDVPDDTHPRDLSEGQRLALALAIVLTARPPLLLLDEPTRGLDYAAKARLIRVLRDLAAEGHAIVLATHDVELAAELAHRVVILADGEVVADGPTRQVVVSSPAFAPQTAKILAPQEWLTVTQVRGALEAGA
ncbi:ATP-binding cassette domain-containing protein, partial [Streptomyces sp. NPDC059744]|uniref:ATP-binding cassette domain-containing protein n=1 Tax=Streptomyces sp. NPDC059744 TaxID=3346929 RepID=UPI0036577E3C